MDTASSTPATGGESSTPVFGVDTYVPPSAALPPVQDFALPAHTEFKKKNASYGALISIIIILAIIVVGAFYSWGKRIEQNNVPIIVNEVPITATTTGN